MERLYIVTGDGCRDIELSATLSMFASVIEALGLDEEECRALLGVNVMSPSDNSGGVGLSVLQERRVRHLIDVGTALGMLLGNADAIVEWMRTPRLSDGGRSPLGRMLADVGELQEVRDELRGECRARFGPLPAWDGE